ncbi:polynucleotide adenylyltransferase PcnB [Roseateles sp. SL47]|uniref:polynucleotide adenylyltransferase PcnB n=1 Tax=Roseateles sp. SL47 TaxID=2995138 RepID=UPI0022711E22|nr:polynucleotide adenylyltransferase PcnB [Roseateles sp. SL47]WAC75441.1 polynucleotide adenylyltransferase PcnB [Roseateles sp. SL47]
MIKKLFNKLLGKPEGAASKATPLGRRVEIGAEEHRIDPELLDERGVKVVQGLTDAGFEAYIVGGAVRDLLLGRRPKDFDVATDATPEQVKNQFRRAFIIGRRFRIVHVVFGRGREHEVIEVSTFRALLTQDDAEQVQGNEKTSKDALAGKSHVVDASGRVLRDNVWGPQVEDAARRDFTVNALYYDPQRQLVVDYHGGLADSRKKVLRMIGDPETRYREDPVRILRAVRFAAKLGFTIEPKTRAPIASMSALLANVPLSRMFDEMIKLLQTGHALASLEELRKQGLARGIFPILDAVLDENGALPDNVHGRFVRLALEDTDKRVAEGRSVAPSFMLACMLWGDVQQRWTRLIANGEGPVPALQQAIDLVFDARVGDISGRGKLAADMREIWMMQPRFERRTGSGPHRLIEQPRYRAGFDFLALRAEAGEVDATLADWWEDFALGNEDERRALLDQARESQRQSGSKSRPKQGGGRVHQVARGVVSQSVGDAGEAAEPAAGKARRGAAADRSADRASDDEDEDDFDDRDPAADFGGEGEGGAARANPARKRRRRRKPKAAGGGGAGHGGGDSGGSAAGGGA